MAEKRNDLSLLTVPEGDAGQRLDRWLKSRFGAVPYVAIQKLLRTGKVRVDGAKVPAAARLEAGVVVSVPQGFGEDTSGIRKDEAGGTGYQLSARDAEMIEAAVVHEDKQLLVLNKPAGLPAQAGGGQVRSLDRILAAMYGAEKAPKLVHRLDRETTGLLVCAKNRTTAAAMGEAFAGRDVKKEYLAVVLGKLPGKQGRIDAPIAKVGPYARVDKDGDTALTTWTWLASLNPGVHLLNCTPHTGRMNQLRVHLTHIGLPMLGDDKYGGEAAKMAAKELGLTGKPPLFLHAWKLRVAHPLTGELLALEAPVPAHFKALFGGVAGL